MCTDCNALWSADGNPKTNGVYMRDNYIRNGRMTIGDGPNAPNFNNVLDGNHLVSGNVKMYDRGKTFQGRIENNTFIDYPLRDCDHLAAGESSVGRPGPTIVRGNKFIELGANGPDKPVYYEVR